MVNYCYLQVVTIVIIVTCRVEKVIHLTLVYIGLFTIDINPNIFMTLNIHINMYSVIFCGLNMPSSKCSGLTVRCSAHCRPTV